MSTKQYFFKNPKTGEVYGYSSDEINKVPQLVNCLELISEGEMRKLTGAKNPTLEAAKAKQLAKVNEKFVSMINNPKAVISVPGVGIVDASKDSLNNISILLELLEAEGTTSTQFRLADNSFVTINLDQLKTVKKVIGKYGLELFSKKWKLEAAIAQADTIPEVESITW